MKPKVYLETTIPSYLAARPSRDIAVAGNQQITRDWWQSRRNVFDLFVSEFVIAEISMGHPEVAKRRLEIVKGLPTLFVTDEVLLIAGELLAKRIIPQKAGDDAAHLAIASTYGCDYLLTWNCRHLANAELYKAMRGIIGRYGYDLPVLCTPQELMGENDVFGR